MNREEWLSVVAKETEKLYAWKDVKIKPYRITCGWPYVNPFGKRIRAGECHSDSTSKAGLHEIFISPLIDRSSQVAGVIAHELVHVAAGVAAKHGPEFTRIARHVGLTRGSATQAQPGTLLSIKLDRVLNDLPEYPHAAIVPVAQKVTKAAHSIKIVCPSCGCSVVISFKWLTQAGFPKCGCGSLMTIGGEIVNRNEKH